MDFFFLPNLKEYTALLFLSVLITEIWGAPLSFVPDKGRCLTLLTLVLVLSPRKLWILDGPSELSCLETMRPGLFIPHPQGPVIG